MEWPHNDSVEKKVLGACMRDTGAFLSVQDILVPDAFYQPRHKTIYLAMIDLQKSGEAIDLVSLAEKLRQTKELEKAGGESVIVDIATSVASTVHAAKHARFIQNKYHRRLVLRQAMELMEQARDPQQEIEDVLCTHQHEISKITAEHAGGYRPLKEFVDSSFDEHLERANPEHHKVPYLDSGIKEIDDLLTGGMHRGGLYVLAAETGDGKTSLAIQIAAQISKKHGHVGFVSLEMPGRQLVDRLLAIEKTIQPRLLTDSDDWRRFMNACDNLSGYSIWIDDDSEMTISKLETRAKRLAIQTEQELSFLVVDYIQLLNAERKSRSTNEGRNYEIGLYARRLKLLAKTLNIPVLALSQINQEKNVATRKPPHLGRLRDSGEIKNHADGVMFIWCEKEEELTKSGERAILLRKHRHGPCGDINIYFEKEFTRFESVEDQKVIDMFSIDEKQEIKDSLGPGQRKFMDKWDV